MSFGERKTLLLATGLLTAFCGVTCVFGTIRVDGSAGQSYVPEPTSQSTDAQPTPAPDVHVDPTAPPIGMPPPETTAEQSPLKMIIVLLGFLALLAGGGLLVYKNRPGSKK